MDVKHAFLQGDLEERVFMVQPPSFQSELNKSVVCRLKKSLYGLKEALRAWNSKITHRLRKMERSERTGPDFVQINQVKSHVYATFEMKDLGDLHYFLGIEVIHTPNGILITQ